MKAINTTHEILSADDINKSTITEPVQFLEFTSKDSLQINAKINSTHEKISDFANDNEIDGLNVKWNEINNEKIFQIKELLKKINTVISSWDNTTSIRSNKNDFIKFTEEHSLYCVSLGKKSSSIIVDNDFEKPYSEKKKDINAGTMELSNAEKIQQDIINVLAEYNKRNLRQQIGDKQLTYVDDVNNTLNTEIPLITKILREVQQKFDNK